METSPERKVVEVQAKKKPPPEKAEAIWLRTKVVLSFWAVILLLGLPTWYQTTSIYRARLPLQEMLDSTDALTGVPKIPLQIFIHAPGLSCSQAQQVIQKTQSILDDANEFPVVHQRLRLVHDNQPSDEVKSGKCGENGQNLQDITPGLDVTLLSGADIFSFDVQNGGSHATVRFPTNALQNLPSEFAKSLQNLMTAEQIAAALQITTHATNNQHAFTFLQSQQQELVNDIHKQLSRAAKTSPTYHLTFSLFSAGGTPSSWDIHELMATHITPLVHALRNTSAINVATQVQLYSPFSNSIQTYQQESHDGTFIRQNDLTAFVNAAEWPLTPSVGDGPTLNFIVFVPLRQQVPLKIEGQESTSWLVPQWGSISIINPELVPHPANGVLSVPGHITATTLSSAFETFSVQLLALLGVLSSESQGQRAHISQRLQSYQRLTALTLHMKAASSLGSLARLAQRLSSIPIPKHVAQLVDNAMSNLTASTKAFSQSQWNDALQHASLAFQDSEKAFFDKSMVGQVYFPDEHKVAVYLPLLGPIGVPLLVALLREIKRSIAMLRSAKS